MGTHSQPSWNTYNLTTALLSGFVWDSFVEKQAGRRDQRSASEPAGVGLSRWLRFEFRFWPMKVSLIHSHKPWTKHLIVLLFFSCTTQLMRCQFPNHAKA